MRRDSPIYTYWAIIVSSLAALAFTHAREIPGQEAMPIFIGAMAFGVLLGDLTERLFKGSPSR